MAKKGQYKANATADSVRQRKYNSSEEQKTRRAQRNAARRDMEAKGKVLSPLTRITSLSCLSDGSTNIPTTSIIGC